MSPIVSPAQTSNGVSPQGGGGGDPAGSGGQILVPHILIQLEDDLERQHRREAAWISVAVHLFAVIFLLLSPKIFGFKPVNVLSAEDIMKNKQLTYLDMPPDMQTPPPKAKPEARVYSLVAIR